MTVTQPRSPALSGETVSGAFPRVEVEEEGFAEEPISQFVLLLPAAPLLLRPGVAHPAAPGVGASSSPPSLLRALGSGREAARSPWLRPFWIQVAWARGCPPREGFAAAAALARQCSRKTAGSTMMKMMMTMIGGPTIGGRCPVMMSDPLSGRCPMGGRAGHHHHHQGPDNQSSAS